MGNGNIGSISEQEFTCALVLSALSCQNMRRELIFCSCVFRGLHATLFNGLRYTAGKPYQADFFRVGAVLSAPPNATSPKQLGLMIAIIVIFFSQAIVNHYDSFCCLK